MKNLKRVLSLGLASVMLVGMMAVGAGAVDYKDFTDKDEIQHTEAVSTMNLLGVIAGKDTGAFDPAGTVTRAEMAKMITVALNGGKDPVLGVKSTPTFSDIKGHWAEKYIEYCASLNIIAGQGDGTFAPNATVTGSQAAKMMLVAMGYEAEVYKMVGADWEINTNREANNAGLFDELDDMDPGIGMSRDNAAQLIWNGIQSKTLTKTPTQSVTTGEITFQYNLNGPSILADKFKVYTSYGQLTTINEGNLSISLDNNYTNQNTVAATGGAVRSAFTKVAADYTEYLGQTVKVLYKASDNVVGVAPVDANNVYDVRLSGVSVNSNVKVRFDGTNYEIENDTNNGANNAPTTSAPDNLKVITINANGTVANSTGTASSLRDPVSFNAVRFIDNDNDGKLEYAVITEMVPGKVTYVSSGEIIAGGTTYDKEDENVDEDIARNDYVVASYNPFTAKKDVVKLEKVEGIVDGYRTADGKAPDPTNYEYRVDGNWYIADNQLTDNGAINAGDEVELWVVNNVVFDVKKISNSASIENLVMVLNSDVGGVSRQAVILHTDGSKQTVRIDTTTKSTGAVVGQALTAGALYTYNESDNGFEFTDAATIGDYNWTRGASNQLASGTIGSTVGGSVLADDAVVMVYFGNDGKVITGKALKTMTGGAAANNVNRATKGFYTTKVDNLDRVTILGVELAAGSSLDNVNQAAENYGLIVSNAYVSGSNPRTVTYDVWTGDETVQVVETTNAALNTRTRYSVIEYSGINGNKIADVRVRSTRSAAVYSIEGNSNVFVSATKAYKLTADTVIMYFDSSSTTTAEIGKAGGELRPADNRGSTASPILVENIRYITSGDSNGADLLFVLVDVKNALANGTKYTVTLPAAGANYTVTGNGSGAGKNEFKAGDTCVVTYTPATNYHLSLTPGAVTVPGVPAANISAPVLNTNGTVTFQFTVPAADVTPTVSATITAVANPANP